MRERAAVGVGDLANRRLSELHHFITQQLVSRFEDEAGACCAGWARSGYAMQEFAGVAWHHVEETKIVKAGFKKVALLSELPEGEMKVAKSPDGVQVSIANIKGDIFCFQDMCSHDLASLSFGWLLQNDYQVECPAHEGRFSLRTGEALQAPATKPISIFDVVVEGNDILVGSRKP